MPSVVFIDTSVLLNLLDVPDRNAERDAVLAEYPQRQEQGQFILPITTVIETGNHIGNVEPGAPRRTCAERFADMLRMVIQGTAPFAMHEMGWDDEFLRHLVAGGRTETPLVDLLVAQVIGCGDLTILLERDRYLARVAKGTSARIWTLDHGLAAYE